MITAQGEGPGYADFAEPEAGGRLQPMEVLATGIHPVTRSLAEGRHYGSDSRYPLVPGVDCVARGADGIAR